MARALRLEGLMRTLAPVLGAIVASLVPLACGGSQTPVQEELDAGIDGATVKCPTCPTSLPETLACPSSRPGGLYGALTLAPGVEGVAVFEVWSGVEGDPPRSRATLGNVCGTARDRDACLAGVASVRSRAGWTYAASASSRAANDSDYGVVTTGEERRVITTTAELLALVAPIDTLDEAAAFAALNLRNVSCKDANALTEADGYVLQMVRGGCGSPKKETLVKVFRDGRIETVSERELEPGMPNCIEGRRPAGYVGEGRAWLSSLPAHVAEIAHMEAAAVLAFEQLERDLAILDAPGALRARAAKATRDERLHAAIMTERALALGAAPARVVSAPAPARSLLDFAILNATEGCVREAYGALVATHQAVHSADPALRAAFVRIAADEAEHAALSLDLAAWLRSRLSPAERQLLARAEEDAFDALLVECQAEVAPEVVREAGMPDARTASALVRGLRMRLALLAA